MEPKKKTQKADEPVDYLAMHDTDADFIDALLDAEREVLVEEGDNEAVEIHDTEAAKIRNGTADGDEN